MRGISRIVFVGIVLFAACDRADLDPVEPEVTAASGSLINIQEFDLRPVPTLNIDRPAVPFSWEESPERLRMALADVNGIGVIGIKPRDATRSATTGIRPELRVEEIVSGLEFLDGVGAEILEYFNTYGAVRVDLTSANLNATSTPIS